MSFSAHSLKRLSWLFLAFAAPSLFAAANFPYPQNRSYAYGFKPAPFGASAAADAATILAKYTSWRGSKRVTVGGCGTPCYRIQGEDLGGDTVSEGISYGMLMAVYFDDQDTFNGLWNYKVSKNDGLGLMHWRINSGGGIVGANSATDADMDIAYSLYVAHYQWGSAGTFNYKALADAEMTKIVAYDLDANRVKPGDSFNDCRYPSYFFPNEHRVFAKEKPGDAATWAAVRTNSYNTIAAARNNTTGLLAEQCTDTGQGGGCFVSSSQYQYNSARIPFRMALDYVYYGDANAAAQLQRTADFFDGIAPGSVVDCYNLNGTTCGGNNHGAFVGPAGTSFMYDNDAMLQTYYNYLMVTDWSSNYFGGSWQILSLLLLSGNMPNIADQGAMFTPTRTRTATPYAGTPTMTPTQTPVAFAYVFEDFENAILVNGYTYAGPAAPAPTPVANHGISNLQNNTPLGTFSNRIQVQKPTTGQYAGVGFDSSYAPATGVMNFTGSTVVRLAVRTDVATSIQISFREGAGVGGGDDEVWSSTVLALAASASWQIVTFNISGFTENIYNPSCATNCLTTGNNVFNLGSVKAVEIAFPSIIATMANIYVDDISFVPSVAPTMTFTKTPFPNPFNQLYDDFESPNSMNAVVPKRVTGYANTVNGASVAMGLDTTTYVAGARSGRLNYNLGTAPASYGGGFSFMSPYNTGSFASPDPLMNGAYFDAGGAVQMQLWMNAPAGLKYRLTLQEAGSTGTAVAGADGESWYSALLTGTGTWTRVTVDIGDFVEDPYNPTCNPSGIAAPGPCITGGFSGNNVPNLNALWQVGLKLPGEQVGVASRTGIVYIDDVNFITSYKSPTITRTFTPGASSPTNTRSATPSATPSATRTATPTSSPTRTASPSGTVTALASTATHTPTGTPSGSPTVLPNTSTHTPTATPSRTATPSASPSATRTATRTASPSATPSATRSSSPSPSATPTITATFTEVPVGSTATPTPSVSPTYTVSPTRTPTLSPTPVDTATFTPASTATHTPVDTATVTAGNTGTFTPVNTATLTSADTATETPQNTATLTAANTGTFTPASTATATPVDTSTSTPAPTGSASSTMTRTGTLTAGSTLTVTSTVTPIATSTATPTVTRTATLTVTRTSTSTPTIALPSPTPTCACPTATVTPTPSNTVVVPPPTATAVPGDPIITAVAYPNPNPIGLKVLLGLPSDGITVKVYSRAMIVVGEASTPGPLDFGWHMVALPKDLPSGTYFFTVVSSREGSEFKLPGGGKYVRIQ